MSSAAPTASPGQVGASPSIAAQPVTTPAARSAYPSMARSVTCLRFLRGVGASVRSGIQGRIMRGLSGR